jgi:hypothetical protein
VDALEHPGPADPARIDAERVCPEQSRPYVEPQATSEPPLRYYVTASCT